MIKKLSIVLLLAVMVLPASVGAAEILPFYDAIFDGQTETWVNPDERIEMNPLVNVDSGEVLHAISTDLIGDGIPRECHDIRNIQGEQQEEVNLTHRDGPPNTDDYGLRITGFLADNMPAANALSGDTACTGDSDILYDEADVVHVIPDGGSSNSSNGNAGSSAEDVVTEIRNMFTDFFASLTAFFQTQAPAAAPVPTGPECPTPYTGFNRVVAQTWLMDNGYAAGFNNVGIMNTNQLLSNSIIWGSVSQTAYDAARAACQVG